MVSPYQFGVCSWSLPAPDTIEACYMTKDLGLSGISLDLGGLGPDLRSDVSRLKSIRDTRSQLGLTFPALAANALCGTGLSNSQKRSGVRKIIEQAVATAEALEISLLQLPSFGDGAIDSAQALEQTAENLQIACDLAHPLGIIVGTENALSVEANQHLLGKVDRPNLRIYFDTSNPFWMSDLATETMIAPLAEHICEYHVKDETRDSETGAFGFAPLGQGGSSFSECVSEIRKTDFRGWIILENYYADPERNDDPKAVVDQLQQDVQTMIKAFESPEHEGDNFV
ncbi:MAG: sugar phosphate isomerase/epimerase family protein [Verrucomicrobiota bacterium]